MRKVTVLSTKTNELKEIQSNATTWGDLKTQVEAAGISTADMKVMEKISRASYDHPGATLPTGDFTIFLTPNKIKSGWVKNV